MTQGELVTRLCKQRDEMAATIGKVIEWVKEEPEGCEYCRERETIALDQADDAIWIKQNRNGRYSLTGCEFNVRIWFCPMCGRDLR